MIYAKPQDFKLTRFYVETEEESIAVQKAMFKMGFRWAYTEGGVDRKVRVRSPGWLAVDHECRIYNIYTADYDFVIAGRSTKAGSFTALFRVAEEFHKQKTQKRKESRMRKQGWIINTGDKPEGVFEAVKFRNGVVRTRLGASDFSIPFAANPEWTVVAYKLKAEPKSETVTFEHMVQEIVKDSKTTQKYPEGFVVFNGNSASVCPVDPDTRIAFIMRGTLGNTHGPNRAGDLRWSVTDRAGDVMAYCVVESKPKAEDTYTKTPEVETNPKKQFGDKAIPLNLWPALASSYGALGLYNGKLKYGQSNFVATPVEASIYIAGAMRHLQAWAEGEEFDPADGVPNLGGVLANIAILLEARAAGTLIDDRKLGTGYLKERGALKAIVASLQELHADKSPRHYTIQDAK